MRRTTTTIFIVAAALAVLAADNDQPTQEPVNGARFGDEVDVTVANLDVFVRDREGRPVEGLTAEDFRVIQDGIEMPISNFAFFIHERPEPVGDVAMAPEAEGRPPASASAVAEPVYVVLHVDNENLHPSHRRRMLKRVKTFVSETLTPPVQMAVVSSRRSIELRQPFTDDPGAVIETLDRISKESCGRIVRDRHRQRILEQMEEFSGDRAGLRLETVTTLTEQATRIQVQAQIVAYAEEESDVLVDTLANMNQVLRLVLGLTGRRSIIYMSGGLPMTPGVGLMVEFATTFQDFTIFTRIPQRNHAEGFRSLANAANRGGVSLYAIDASGLNPLEGFGADDRFVPAAAASWATMRNLQEPLKYMADATGGVAVLNTNDVTAGLRLIRDDLFSYYSLGYRISSNGEDTVHRLEVELPGHPDYDIRYRKWLVEKSLETTVREQVLQTLITDVGHNPMDLRLTVGDPAPVSGKRWKVPFWVSIPINSLAMEAEAGDLVGHVELFFGVRDVRGHESPTQRRQYEVRIPAAQFALDPEQRCGIMVELLFKEQQHTVAVGLMDRGTRQTSYARTVVGVP
ncbi:MAG: VWA domain-containing protein [Acidobacteria bacterium]|nr:VWA domain-containing protein [Acidobacteriota bacterium]